MVPHHTSALERIASYSLEKKRLQADLNMAFEYLESDYK